MPPEAKRRPRVTLVLHTFDQGGSGRVAAHLAQGFSDAGLDARLAVFARGGSAEKAVGGIMASTLPIQFLGDLGGSRAVDLLRGLPALVRTLREERPDVVVAAANNVALVTAVAVRLSGLESARLYLKTTNPIATSRHRGVAKMVRRGTYALAFRRAAAVLTLSAEESAEMKKVFPRHAAIFRDVANPYVTPAMLDSPAARPRDGRTVICVARLVSQKRLDRLVAAFAEIRTPGARLLILGEGGDRAALTALVGNLGVADRVAMPGFSGNVAGELRAADLFVLTSDYEGLPAVVLEAMAAGCPVLATDCFPAARSLLGPADGCGLVEDVGSAALAAQIDRMLASPRPAGLELLARRYSIANGVAEHMRAMDL